MSQNGITPVFWKSVVCEVDLVPIGKWDDNNMHIGPLGTSRESLCRWFGDGKNDEES